MKRKHQVTVPAKVRAELKLEEGDWLEVQVQDNRIILTPQVVLDQATLAAINEGLEAYEAGDAIDPSESVEAFKEYIKNNP